MLPNMTLSRQTPFLHDSLGLDPIKLESITREDGYRVYITPEGNRYPSITTVLGSMNGDWLGDWRARVGEKEAARVGGLATRRGNIIHKTLEIFIKENTPIDLKPLMPDVRQMLRATVPVLEHINSVVMQETSLYSDRLQIAGTTDLIGFWDGVLSVIDFKNSNRQKTKEDIEGYFAQCAGYAAMFEERYGIKIDQVVVIIAVEGFPTQVFVDKAEPHLPYLLEAIAKHRDNHGNQEKDQGQMDR